MSIESIFIDITNSSDAGATKLPLSHPATRFIMPVLARSNAGEFVASGTAFLVAPYLAVTATHVLMDLARRTHRRASDPAVVNMPFWLTLSQMNLGGDGALSCDWISTKQWAQERHDLAFVRLEPGSMTVEHLQSAVPFRHVADMTVIPPKVGERVVAVGFPEPKILVKAEDRIDYHLTMAATYGTVSEVHPGGRDRCMLPFGCFAVTADFRPSMSGGPIFNSEGRVCGIVCSGTNTEPGIPPISYGALLWPLLGVELDMRYENVQLPPSYEALQLARSGLIQMQGWERVSIHHGEDGERRTRVTFSDAP